VTTSVELAVRTPPDGADPTLERGLALARRTRGLTLIAWPMPVAPASALLARPDAAVAWSARDRTLVGLGAAVELRGTGEARWREVIDGARAIAIGARLGAPEPAVRWLGGAAFVPGAADRAPWTGFGDAWFVLPRWSYAHDGARAQLVLAIDAAAAEHAARWRDGLAAIRVTLAAPAAPRPQPALRALDPGDTDAWRAQVRAVTDAIARGACAKVVLARRATVELASDVRAADVMAELDLRHADCVRALVRPPGAATLIAATPERLVRLDGDRAWCDALAGSRACGDAGDAAALLASGKDRREHDLVVRAIVDALRAAGGDVVAPEAPAVRALRHVLHLHTPITATLPARHHVLELAARLHPTPAVGGTPTAVATEWIGAHEPDPRGWYAAPIGWFDLDGNGELAVAIRSGVIDGARAHLWAGAGIVAGSDPDRELAETELKLRAMLGALGIAR